MATANDTTTANVATADIATGAPAKPVAESAPAPKPAPVADTPVPLAAAPADSREFNSIDFDNKALAHQISLLLGKVPDAPVAVVHSMLAQAVGMAMQNIVAQQQQMQALGNAIASRALKALAENEPKAALEEVSKLLNASNPTPTLESLARLVPGAIPGVAAPKPADS